MFTYMLIGTEGVVLVQLSWTQGIFAIISVCILLDHRLHVKFSLLPPSGATDELFSLPPVLCAKDGKSGGFCTSLFLELLSKADATPKHLEYVVCDVFPRLKVKRFDASGIPLSKMMNRSHGTKLLETMIKSGVLIDGKAIQLAVKTLPDTNTKILSLIVSKWNQVGSLSAPLEAAIQARKINFVACLLEHGAGTPNTGIANLLLDALQREEFRAAESLLNVAGKIPSDNIDLGGLITRGIINHPSLIRKLIEAGVNPNGLGKTKTLAQVLQLTYLATAKQVHTICLLLENGADCKYLCDASATETTPLHIATELALSAGTVLHTIRVHYILPHPCILGYRGGFTMIIPSPQLSVLSSRQE